MDRLAFRPVTFDDVRTVTAKPGASEVAGALQPVAAVDRLVDATIPLADMTVAAIPAAMVVAWCGGVMHAEVLAAVLEATLVETDRGGTVTSGEIVRLHNSGQMRVLAELAPRLDRPMVARVVADVAARVVARPRLTTSAQVAALRPIPVLLAAGDLAITDTVGRPGC